MSRELERVERELHQFVITVEIRGINS